MKTNKTIFEVIGMGSKKYGGFEKYIVCEAKHLAKSGYQLIVIFDRSPICEQYINDLDSLGVKIEVLEQTSRMSFIKGYIRLIKKYKPSIVHTNFSSNIFMVHPISWLYGIKVRVATEHCYPVYKSFLMKLAISILTLFITDYIAVSKKSENSLREAVFFGKKKFKTLYLGVEDFTYNKSEMRKKYNLPEHSVILTNIAYHHPVKGVDVLIKALSIFFKNNPDADLLLCQIGGGQTGVDTDELIKLSKNLRIEDKIIWMGIQNHVTELLSASDIYIQPSRSEGVPLSVMEAGLASLPTIATEAGGLPEAAVDGLTAIVTDIGDITAIAKAIENLYFNKDLRIIMGTNARTRSIQNFCLNVSVQNLISKYYGIDKV